MRQCIVFYSTLGNIEHPELLEQDVSHILDMPFQDIKTQLLPMLHINAGKYPKDEINRIVIEYLSSLLKLEEAEKQYINEKTATTLLAHPVALRTQLQIKEIKEKISEN